MEISTGCVWNIFGDEETLIFIHYNILLLVCMRGGYIDLTYKFVYKTIKKREENLVLR